VAETRPDGDPAGRGENSVAQPGNQVSNHLGGAARSVAQVGAVHGDVHLTTCAAPASPALSAPAQVPDPTRNYTNNDRQLEEIGEALRPGSGAEDEPPRVVVIQDRATFGGGKSATAYQWLHRHRRHYPDGLFHARLSARSESDCLRDFLRAVGFADREIPANLEGRHGLFRGWSTGRRVAVVVDDAVAPGQVRRLLPGPGGSAVLVTAAGPLGGLRVQENAAFVELDPLRPESAQLLVRRVLGEHDPRPDREPEQLAELVARSEGSTLVLCLAAQLLFDRPNRPISRLVADLSREDRRLRALARTEDGAVSIVAALNMRLELLDDATRRVYAALGCHPGSGDVAPEAIAAALDEDVDEVRDRLDELVDARIVQETAADRFFAIGPVRDHARECGGDPGLRARFADHYVRLAIPAGNAVIKGRGWLERKWGEYDLSSPLTAPEAWLEAERGTLTAVAGLLREAADPRLLPFAVALWPFHERAKHLDDMDAVNEHAAELADHLGDRFAAGLARVQRGFAFRHRGERDKAAELFTAAEELARAAGEAELRATAVESLGLVRREQGDPDAARQLLEHNLELAVGLGDPRRTALAKMHLGSVAEPGAAVALLDEAIAAFRALPDVHNEHKSLLWRGIRLTELGRIAAAEADLTAALRHMTDENRRFEIAQARHALGRCALAAGDGERGREHCAQAAAIYRTWGFLDQAERVEAELS